MGKISQRAMTLPGLVPEIGSGRSTEDLYDYLMNIWKPTVVAINGHCLAQSAGIACSCDIRIAADDAKLGWPQSQDCPSLSIR